MAKITYESIETLEKKKVNLKLYRLIRFKEYLNRIKDFPNEHWYDIGLYRQGYESNHWNSYKDWIKSKNAGTNQSSQTQGLRGQMYRFKGFQNILIWINMIRIMVYMKQFKKSRTPKNKIENKNEPDHDLIHIALKKSFNKT